MTGNERITLVLSITFYVKEYSSSKQSGCLLLHLQSTHTQWLDSQKEQGRLLYASLLFIHVVFWPVYVNYSGIVRVTSDAHASFYTFCLSNPIIPCTLLPAKHDFDILKVALFLILYCKWLSAEINSEIRSRILQDDVNWGKNVTRSPYVLPIINRLLMHSGHTHGWSCSKEIWNMCIKPRTWQL